MGWEGPPAPSPTAVPQRQGFLGECSTSRWVGRRGWGAGGETEARPLLGCRPGRPGDEVSGPPVRALLGGVLGPTPGSAGAGRPAPGPWGAVVSVGPVGGSGASRRSGGDDSGLAAGHGQQACAAMSAAPSPKPLRPLQAGQGSPWTSLEGLRTPHLPAGGWRAEGCVLWPAWPCFLCVLRAGSWLMGHKRHLGPGRVALGEWPCALAGGLQGVTRLPFLCAFCRPLPVAPQASSDPASLAGGLCPARPSDLSAAWDSQPRGLHLCCPCKTLVAGAQGSVHRTPPARERGAPLRGDLRVARAHGPHECHLGLFQGRCSPTPSGQAETDTVRLALGAFPGCRQHCGLCPSPRLHTSTQVGSGLSQVT